MNWNKRLEELLQKPSLSSREKQELRLVRRCVNYLHDNSVKNYEVITIDKYLELVNKIVASL